jgi:hypothetical protein
MLLVSFAVFLLGAAFVSLYSQGYALDEGFRIARKGALFVSIPSSDTKIYVNEKKVEPTGFLQSSVFLSHLKPEEYTVITDREGYWPWKKDLKVLEGYITEARSFMIPKEPKGELIFKGKITNMWGNKDLPVLVIEEEETDNGKHLIFYRTDKNIFLTEIDKTAKNNLTYKNSGNIIEWGADYAIFKNSLAENIKISFNLSNETISAEKLIKLPENFESTEFTRYDARKEQKMWWDKESGQVFIDWVKNEKKDIPYYLCPEKNCEWPIMIFDSSYEVKNTDFYPGRRDLVIIATSNTVWVMETDSRGDGRLGHPIYKGKEPVFTLASDDQNIYVLDNGNIIKIKLEK